MSQGTFELERLKGALEKARPVAEAYAPNKLREYEELWKKKTKDGQKPVIMLYGMYSHGKSTLVNALLGREEAEIGISPTTDKVQDYPWVAANCILRDTPGIQAREADSKVTAEELRTCELIAFVVESGMVEERLVWETLVKMLAHKQKVCLIINDFDKCRDDPQKFTPLTDKFRRYIQEEARRQGIGENVIDDVPILVADIKLGLKAKQEEKRALLEYSKLPELERELMRLASSFNLSDVYNTLRNNLLDLVKQCHQAIARKESNRLLEEAEKSLSSIKEEEKLAYDAVRYEIEQRVDMRTSEIHSLYEGGSEEQLRQGFARIADELSEEIGAVIERVTQRTAQRIQKFCEEFDKIRNSLSPQSLGYGSSDPGSADTVKNVLANMQSWGNMLNVSHIPWEEWVKNATVTILKQLKEWFPKFFYGKGAATFAKWAGAFSKALGPLIAVATTIFQVYSDYRAEQEARERAIRREEAIKDAVLSAKKKLEDIFLKVLDQLFAKTFGKVIGEIENQVKELRQKNFSDKEQYRLLQEAEELLKV